MSALIRFDAINQSRNTFPFSFLFFNSFLDPFQLYVNFVIVNKILCCGKLHVSFDVTANKQKISSQRCCLPKVEKLKFETTTICVRSGGHKILHVWNYCNRKLNSTQQEEKNDFEVCWNIEKSSRFSEKSQILQRWIGKAWKNIIENSTGNEMIIHLFPKPADFPVQKFHFVLHLIGKDEKKYLINIALE